MSADITIRDTHGCCDVLTQLEQLITSHLIFKGRARIEHVAMAGGYSGLSNDRPELTVDACNLTVAFVDAEVLPLKVQGEVEIGGYFADWHARIIVDSIEESGNEVSAVYEIASGRL